MQSSVFVLVISLSPFSLPVFFRSLCLLPPPHALFDPYSQSPFFHFRIPYPVFLTDGLLRIDDYRLSFHLLADFCYSHFTSLFGRVCAIALSRTRTLFGFAQVVATADATAQALSTPPLTVPSSPVKKGLYNTSSLVRIYYQLFSPVYCPFTLL